MNIVFLTVVLIKLKFILCQISESDDKYCVIDLDTLKENHPILVDATTGTIIEPNLSQSKIHIKQNQTVELHCPNSNVVVRSDNLGGKLDIRCEYKKGYSSRVGNVTLETILCRNKVSSTVRETNRTCSKVGKVLEVGFQLIDGRFIIQYLLCFDFTKMVAVSSYHKMSRWSALNRHPSSSYLETTFENDNIPYEKLYSKHYQQEHINAILNIPKDRSEIISNSVFLRHCFLVPKSSFMYSFQQTAVSKYINTFPQWWHLQFFNWYKIQRFALAYTNQERVELDVFTGTYGVMQIRNHLLQVNKNIYLYGDEDAELIPVALLHWKVLYDPVNQRGIAFIALNDPFFKDDFKSLFICPDISSQLGRLWDVQYNYGYNYKYGFMYACKIQDLRKAIPDIPAMKVKSLFTLYNR